MAINLTEAVSIAWLFRRYGQPLRPLGSLSWLLRFTLTVGVAGPLIGGALAAGVLHFFGIPMATIFFHYVAGHALGNITFTPLALLLARGRIGNDLRRAPRRDIFETVALLGVVVLTTVIVFSQRQLPLLFVPILPIIMLTFRIGRGGAALAIVIVALIGGGATMAGMGPIDLIGASLGAKLQFFQFYLATTVLTVLPVAADLQNRSRLHRTMRLSEERYRLIAEHSTDIMMHLEADGRIRYVSPSILQLGGYRPSDLIGRNAAILIVPEDLAAVRFAHARTMSRPGETHRFEYRAEMVDGSRRWFETHARTVVDDQGMVDGMIQVVRDISASKATEHQLAEAALTDVLTGLPNRRAFRAAIEAKSNGSGIGRADCVAVLDLDNFKAVNDSFGHDAGDDVLRNFARISRTMVRDGDVLARIGGEEFAIFFPDTAPAQAKLICDRLGQAMGQWELRVGGTSVRVTVSGGVAAMSSEGIDDTMSKADHALYRAKRNGRDQFALAA